MAPPSIKHPLLLLEICSTNRTAAVLSSAFFSFLFSSQSEPPCLLRKPKRAESEIPSLPEAGAAALPFEKAAWKDQRASPEGAAGPYCAAAP